MTKHLSAYRPPSKGGNTLPPPPSELSKSGDGEIAAPPKPAPVPSDKVSYSSWAGVSRVQTQSLDKFGNAKGDEFDLVKDDTFDNEKIFVFNLVNDPTDIIIRDDFTKKALCAETALGSIYMVGPINALARKGFQVVEISSTRVAAKALKSILKDVSQIWLISGHTYYHTHTNFGRHHRSPPLKNYVIDVIRGFFEEGRGLYLLGSRDPWFHHANQITQILFGTTMSGNSPGSQIVSLCEKRDKVGIIPNHLIITGIVNMYEGINIAEVHTNHLIKPLIYGSNGKVLAAYYDQDGKRAIIDGGFSRLHHEGNPAGRDRYIVNAAVWLANIERFPKKNSREQSLR